MPAFIVVDATSKHDHTTRPVHVRVDSIAHITSSGDGTDPDAPAAITFVGGLNSPNERLITTQTASQVMALVAAALS